MNGSFKIGRIFGIQFRLHYSWFFIFALVTFSLIYPDFNRPLYWVAGIITSLLFFASVLGHELAHSLVGRRHGIPVSSITLFIFGGLAAMTHDAKKASDEFKMAIAGPLFSLLAGGCFALIWLLTDEALPVVAIMAQWLALVNILLALFNMIPGFPLDGGRVFRSLLWKTSDNYLKATRIAARVGQWVGFSFIGIGVIVVIFFNEYWFNGLWLVFIGWFLANAAGTSYQQARYSTILGGFKAAQIMNSDYTVTSPIITVGELVREHIFWGGRRFFVVMEEGRVSGVVTLNEIKNLPRASWNEVLVGEIMVPKMNLPVATPETDTMSLIAQMDEYRLDQMLVMSKGKVVGMVDRNSILHLLKLHLELGR